jgi:hypothetical protein
MSDKKVQIAVVVIAVVILVAGVLYLRSLGKGKESENETVLNITLIGRDGDKLVLDYDDLTAMESVEGKVSYQNRLGNWGDVYDLVAVKISTIVETAGGMEPGDALRVTSGDGYYQDYVYYNVYPDADWQELQGDFVLAFSSGEQTIPAWEDGPMAAFLPPDEEYSNDDCKYTSAPGQGYFVNPSGGGRFVKDAWKIEVVAGTGPAEWAMYLDGALNKSLSGAEFGSLASEQRVNVTQGGTEWSGIPMWSVVALIDGGPRRGEGSFNESYAADGYEVKVVGSTSKSFSSHDIAGNDGILIADHSEGAALSSPVLVSPDTTVEDITGIRLFPLWKTKVSGEKTVELFYSEISELDSMEGTAGFLKVTGNVVGPMEIRAVPILSVLELSGPLPSDYSVEVKAVDGYSIMLSKEEVEGQVDIYDASGNKIGFGGATCVICYEVDDSTDFSGEPFRIGYLKGEDAITDGHYWVKEVNSLTIKQPVTDWTLELKGLTEYSLNRTAFESAATCSEHRVALNITRKGETHSYQGLPIWVPISIIDGKDDPEGHYFFNDELARDGYDVLIVAADGFNTTLNSSLLWRNDGMILAYLMDGEVLPEGDGPLMVVGEGLSGKQMVKQVVSMRLLLPVKWTVNLSGLTDAVLDSRTFEDGVACEHGTEIELTRKEETHTYTGLPLWIVVGMVDGGDSGDHYLFNYELTDAGYDVQIVAVDGFNTTLNSSIVAGNDGILLASLEDGLPLSEDDGPLKIVGEGLSGKQMVKQVVKIEIILPDQQ